MSQLEVFKILKELGGEASTGQIKDRVKEKCPNLSLHFYVYNRLNRLYHKQYVTRYLDKKGIIVWKIINEYSPE